MHPRLLPLLVLSIVVASCVQAPSEPEAPAQEFNVLGRPDAPVTIIEFTDLQCPYCARFATQTFPKIRRSYVDTGKVRYTSRDLPLPMHEFAVPAAVAARCAGEQGRFWEYREALFAMQDHLGSAPYEELARKFGLDTDRFASCRADGRQESKVRADLELAKSFGIASTPTFAIGRLVDGVFEGEAVRGAKTYEDFAARIDILVDQSR
jgi:protein-disulfide isomerase